MIFCTHWVFKTVEKITNPPALGLVVFQKHFQMMEVTTPIFLIGYINVQNCYKKTSRGSLMGYDPRLSNPLDRQCISRLNGKTCFT